MRWIVLFFSSLCVMLNNAHRYVVTTYTGDRFGAGTDARVFVKFYGTKGVSEEKELESSGRDNFERGQLDTFLIDIKKNIGSIKKAAIRHDNSWLGPGWYLEKVTVTSEDGDYYEFPVHKWLDKHQDDGMTNRELIPRPTSNVKKNDIETIQPLDCSWPQGVSNGLISDSQISASTSFNDLHLPYHARLGKIVPSSLGGWCPYKDDAVQYLQIDLAQVKKIAGVATQGMGLVDEWTTAYRVMYSNNSESNFKEYSENSETVKNFIGNDDQNGTVLHWLKKPFISRYVRISPLKWHGKGCLRAELYGCPVNGLLTEDSSKSSDLIQLPDSQTSDEPFQYEQHKSEEAISKGGMEYHETGDKHGGIPSAGHEPDDMPKATETQLTQSEAETLDVIPIVHLDFDEIHDNVVPDVSGHHNDAHLNHPIDIVMFSKSCERGLKINGGDLYFDGEFFINKPKSEITIAVWIKLFSNGGQHSIFDTIGGKDSIHKDGQFHFEVDRGRLRWFHRNEAKDVVFNVSSPLMVPAHIWTHCAATYSSLSGKATVFVNGKFGAEANGVGTLSQDWSGHAGIGRHKGLRVLNGEIDEFYIFAKALPPNKIELLMKRCSFETDCQKALGMQSKLIKDSQISASSTYNLHKPYYGRVNLASFFGDPARTAWCANKEDKNPYLEIELSEMTSLTGVATQGLSIFDNWVTSFLFCYSDNRAIWNCYKEKGYDKVFEANSDKNTVKHHYFHHPVDGKFVRIRPQSWYGNHLCMRAEVYGCAMDLLPDPYDSFGSLPIFMEDTEAQTRNEVSPKESCNNPLGVSNGEVDDMHLSASSSLDLIHFPYYGRLIRESIDQSDIKGCWCAHDVNLRQYIQADLGEVKTVTGIATQGYIAHDNWVASYRLGYSENENSLEWYRENDDERLFLGNVDRTSIVKHFLKHPIQARFVRINPRAWHGIHICMRFEIFGCQNDENNEASLSHSEIDDLFLRGDIHKDKDSNEQTGDYKHKIPPKKSNRVFDNDGIRLPHTPLKLNKVHKAPEDNALQRQLTPGVNLAKQILHTSYPKPKFNLHFFKNMSFSEPMIPSHKLPIKVASHTKPSHPQHKPSQPNNFLFHKPTQQKNVKNIFQLGDNIQQFSSLNDEMKQPLLQEFSNDNQMKPLLQEFENKKNIDDKKNKEKLIQNFFDNHLPNCKRNNFGDCKPVTDYYKNIPSNINIAAMFPRATNSFGLPQHLPMHHAPLINSAEVLTNFPELRENGITEEVLQSLAEHIPDLEKRIYAHFAMKNNMLLNHENNLLHQNNMWQQNDLEQSNLAFMKNYKDYLTYMNQETGPESEISAGLLPDQHRVNEAIVEPEMPYSNPWNTGSTQSFVEQTQTQQNLLNHQLQSENQPLFQNNHLFQDPQQYFSNNNQETFSKPYEFENPCTRSGGCNPIFPNVGLSEQYAFKNPLATPHSSNVYHDNTKYTPDELLPSAPDPRFVEYYNKYMEGKSMEDEDTSLRHPPPVAQPSSYIEQSTSLSFSLPSQPTYFPPPPPPFPPHPPPHPPPPPPLPPPPPPPPPSPPLQIPFPLSSSSGAMPIIESSVYLETLTTPPPLDVQMAYSLSPSSVSDDSSINEDGGDWTPYSVCSTTCGRGEKKRFRRCSVAECPSGSVEVESSPCALDECPEVNPYSWSSYTPCSTTCGTGTSVRYRLCNTKNCPEDGYETELISCYKPSCPVCLLDFEVIINSMVLDQSGHGNSGYLDKNTLIREHPQICGHYADLSRNGQIIISAHTFLFKPRNGISIACWVNIQTDNMSGKHSIFSTIREVSQRNFLGGYHFELDGGGVRWFHRDEYGTIVFSILTDQVTLPRVWMHICVTYDAYKGLAKIFVDGKERGSKEGRGLLSLDWGYKASIGSYDFDNRQLIGWVDEFIIYDYALEEEQAFNLLGKMRCPTSNATTVEIDAFKFENIHNKRGLMDSDANTDMLSRIKSLSEKNNAGNDNKTLSKLSKILSNTTLGIVNITHNKLANQSDTVRLGIADVTQSKLANRSDTDRLGIDNITHNKLANHSETVRNKTRRSIVKSNRKNPHR